MVARRGSAEAVTTENAVSATASGSTRALPPHTATG